MSANDSAAPTATDRRPRWLVKTLVALVLVHAAPAACGGTVNGGSRGGSEVTEDGGPVEPDPGLGGGEDPPSTCGNGRVDPGEDCDGTSFGAATCYAATMGAKPNGSLVCSSGCRRLTTKCQSSGPQTGTGGYPVYPPGMGGGPVAAPRPARCNDDGACGIGRCIFGRCEPSREEGDICEEHADCQDGLMCFIDGAPTGVCTIPDAGADARDAMPDAESDAMPDAMPDAIGTSIDGG